MAHSYLENRQTIIDIIRSINPSEIIDIGLGAGDYGEPIKRALPNVHLIGVDAWREYENDQWNYYDEVVISDMREYDFPKTELTLFIDSLEHIEKDDALKVLSKLKNNALISIPINYIQPDNVDFYDKHRSEWTLEDFKDFTYDNYSNERSIILCLKFPS